MVTIYNGLVIDYDKTYVYYDIFCQKDKCSTVQFCYRG